MKSLRKAIYNPSVIVLKVIPKNINAYNYIDDLASKISMFIYFYLCDFYYDAKKKNF